MSEKSFSSFGDLETLFTEIGSKIRAKVEQVSTMPTATADNYSKVLQYVGASTSSYTHGFYYECQNVNGSYQWVNIPVGNDPVKISNSDPYTYRKSLGNLADMGIVGASVGWNQLARPFGTTYYNQTNIASISYTDNVATFTANAQDGRVYLGTDYRPAIYSSHVYFASVKVKPSTSTDRIQLLVAGTTKAMPVESINWTEIAMIMSPSSDSNNPVIGVRDHRTSGWDAVQAKELVFIDLTLLFGSTIADAIYAMEQATAGAGIAFFRKYFSKDYYAYDAGSIQSVCVGSRKVVTGNFLDESTLALQTYGANQRIGYSPLKLFVGTYTLSKQSGNITLYIKDYETTSTIATMSGSSISFTLESDKTVYVASSLTSLSSYTNSGVMLEKGSTATEYKPYNPILYPFDSTKQLRGMFSLSGNELKASGDVYTADGKIQRKYGIVDLGTLTWKYYSSGQYFYSTLSNAKAPSSESIAGNIVCAKYPTVPNTSPFPAGIDKVICLTQNGQLELKDTAYNTDVATFTTAMSGVYLVYELATPTTEYAQPYQNPQRAYIDGTEEFTDGLTRDVMIPVGNNTTYQQDKILPSVEDYVDSITKTKADISAIAPEENGATASKAYTTGQHFYKDGKFCTAIANIASNAAFTLNTNYSESDIATIIASLEARITELES